MLSYILLNGSAWVLLKISGGRIAPPNYDLAERWAVPPGGIMPGWVKVILGRKDEVPINVQMVNRSGQEPSLDEHTKGSLASE